MEVCTAENNNVHCYIAELMRAKGLIDANFSTSDCGDLRESRYADAAGHYQSRSQTPASECPLPALFRAQTGKELANA